MTSPHPDKWTLGEFDQCVHLVGKARRLGVYDSVMNRVKRIENGLQVEFMANGLADGDLVGVDFTESARVEAARVSQAAGAMTDAAKRRGGPLEESPVAKTALAKASPYASPSGVLVPPMPSYDSTGHEMHLSPLPTGISSLRQWGDNLVTFGKYAKKKRYHEILNGTADEFVSYRKYLLSHYESGSALLRDLVNFMKASGFTHESDDRPCIPGTHVPRSYG